MNRWILTYSRALIVFLLTVLTVWWHPAAVQAQDNPPVVIASKDFPENRLLAEIMAQLIEQKHPDIPVIRKFNLGSALILFPALKTGEIDIYPEYTGTAWSILLKIQEPVRDPLRAYLRVAQAMRQDYQIELLMPFGFENSYAMAMAEERAKELGVTRVSDLIPLEDKLTLVVSPEFAIRDDGLKGLKNAYKLAFPKMRTMEHGLAYEAIRSGKADLVDTWTTDGKLAKIRMRLLEDDLDFFPPYDAVPMIRMETLLRYPELKETINLLAFRLSDERMQKLNQRVEEGEAVPSVASSFLRSEDLGDRLIKRQSSVQFFAFMRDRAPELLHFTLEHIILAGIAVALACLLAIPLGILLTRFSSLTTPVLGTAGVIQTIPSLALLAFMIPLLGLGEKPAVAALTLYAILPILRNTYTGIKEVDESLIEAARGIGLTNWQILTRVELPLATRTIMAGVRTSTVISIGVATLAAFIGAGGLGDPIVTGLQVNSQNWVLSGAIPAAILALIVDFSLGQVEWFARPRGVGDR